MFAAVAVATFVVAAVAGCTPPAQGRIGLHLVDGRVEALVHECPGNTFAQFVAYADDGSGDQWAVAAPTGGPQVTPAPAARDLKLTVFGSNDGLQAKSGGLTSFAKGRQYAASAGLVGSNSGVSLGHFTSDDLAKTDSGHVLTGTSGNVQVMSIADFDKQADQECHPHQ